MFGVHAVKSLLTAVTAEISQVYLKKSYLDAPAKPRIKEIIQLLVAKNIPHTFVATAVLDRMVAGAKHQGLVAQLQACHALPAAALPTILAKVSVPLILILDSIQDPHNLGACLRTADACAVTTVIIPKDKAVGLTATVAKVACGAATTVPVIQVTNLVRTMIDLQQRGVWIFGLSSSAPQSIYTAKLNTPLALVLGNEGSGMRRLTREHCDVLVKIPMQGVVTSLNVAAATAVCLYEAVRQRDNSHS